ncbi:MAG: hypothetical protein ABSH44_01535 [Bryobacteraceae bacterium]
MRYARNVPGPRSIQTQRRGPLPRPHLEQRVLVVQQRRPAENLA